LKHKGLERLLYSVLYSPWG